ncbi:hypothetical protein NM688_g6093 [Phlebia brevispora]|uniref:Uncharacterized protein n=1 Tax=Phlebia brevispora TaxID=194682 RepID=A0ACC1SK69_9APHY|nr:hypothetical protein NM688_g6093 [Phlebia brevispora]
MPTTPTSMATFPSLVQENIKPNPHPYAIRTTSTGVLSRSNSSGRNLAASHHHYVPLPPSPTKREVKLHRPVKSLTSKSSFPSLETPKPLPVPPEFTSNAGRPGRRTRAETLPSLPLAPEGSIAPAELPANPKLWTVSQLSTYLLTALRVSTRSLDCDETLPLVIVQDVATIVREAKINGRLFLRLNEEDLER